VYFAHLQVGKWTRAHRTHHGTQTGIECYHPTDCFHHNLKRRQALHAVEVWVVYMDILQLVSARFVDHDDIPGVLRHKVGNCVVYLDKDLPYLLCVRVTRRSGVCDPILRSVGKIRRGSRLRKAWHSDTIQVAMQLGMQQVKGGKSTYLIRRSSRIHRLVCKRKFCR